MKKAIKPTNSVLAIMLSALTVISCGGNGNNNNNNSPDPGSESTSPFKLLNGFTLVRIQRTDVANNRPPETVSLTTDIDSNTITVQQSGNIMFTANSYTYNESGQITDLDFGTRQGSVTYNPSGEIVSLLNSGLDTDSEIFYYEGGKLIRHEEIFFDTFLSAVSYAYDDSGSLVSAQEQNSGSADRFTYSMSGTGLITEAVANESWLPADERIQYQYDSNDNLIGVDRFSQAGALRISYSFEYEESTEPTPNLASFLVSTSTFYYRFD